MRKTTTAVLCGALLLLTATIARPDVGPSEFYRAALHRGVEQYEHGRYEDAVKLLRVAAFGCIDDTAAYQRAYAYIALAADRMDNEPARAAALVRIATADKLAPGYAWPDLGANQQRYSELLKHYQIILAPQRTSNGPSAQAPPIPPQPKKTAEPQPAPARPQPRPTPAPAQARPETQPPSAKPAVAPPQGDAKAAAPAPQPAAKATAPPQQQQQPAAPPQRAVAAPATKAPATTAPATNAPATVEPPSGAYALQVAIACEERTVAGLRETFDDLSLIPMVVNGRTCQRVITGHYASRDAAAADRENVRRLAHTSDAPIVVRRDR